MAIAYGNRAGSNHGNTNGAAETVTTSVNIPAGALIIVSVSGSNVGDTSNLASVTDSASNTYQSGGFTCDPGQNTLTAVWYSLTGNALGSGGTVTVNFNTALLSSGESWQIAVDYLTGAATSSATDGSNGHNSQTGATWDTNSITTTNAADLLWVAAGVNQGAPLTLTNGNSLPNSGWTTQTAISGGAGNNNQLSTAYQVVAATGTYKGGGTATTGNNGTSAVIVAFKAAAGGGGVAIVGEADGVGASTLALTVSHLITGTAAGAGVATLTLTVSHLIVAEADGVGVATLALTVSHLMTGEADGVGTATLALTVSHLIVGTAAGVGTATLSLIVGGVNGQANGVGAATLVLTVSHLVVAEADGAGSATLVLLITHLLVGRADGSGSATLTLTTGTTGIALRGSTVVRTPLHLTGSTVVRPHEAASATVARLAPAGSTKARGT